MTDLITQSFSICTHNYTHLLGNDLSKVDRGKSEKEKIIQFQQENIKNADTLLLILSQHNYKFPLSKSVPTYPGKDNFYFESKDEITFGSQIGNVRSVKELITDQIINPVTEIAVNKQIEELKNDNKLKFFPMNPDIVAINFDFDNNNNLIMYQKLQYKEYARYTPDGANTERHVVCEGEDPYVTVDYYVKFSPAGDIINDGSNLEIQFNGCGDDLKAVFDKRSLWAKICDYFREVFNFHSDISGMSFMAPDVDNKEESEFGRGNILMKLRCIENKIKINELKDLKKLDDVEKYINDQQINNITSEYMYNRKVSMGELAPVSNKTAMDKLDKRITEIINELNSKIEAEREKLKKYNE